MALARCERGECKRLIVNMPPRSLKSFTASVAFPGWMLGRNPEAKIMCVAGHRGLADDQHELTKRLLAHRKYRSVFPHVRTFESHGAIRLRQGGIRSVFSTTVALTGRGADMIIRDDPQRIGLDEADERRASDAAWSWYRRNVEQRLNNPRDGVIIVVMQRLSSDDLTSKLLESGGWEVVSIPLIAEGNERYPGVVGGRVVRSEGELLNAGRTGREHAQQLLMSVGARPFLAQYQQQPAGPGEHSGGGIDVNTLLLELDDELKERFPGVGGYGITIRTKEPEEALLTKYFGWTIPGYAERERLRDPTDEEYKEIMYHSMVKQYGQEHADAWRKRC